MKRWLKPGLILVLVLVVAFLGISVYLGYSMTRIRRAPVAEDPALLGLACEDVSFSSNEEGLTLRGWFLPAQDTERVIIMVHGADGHRADPSIGMLPVASQLVAHGYNVLTFDLRGHGESDGNRISAGYNERKDLLGAVSYLESRGFRRIGVLGFSMGAVATLLAAAESDAIAAVVSDSAFADIKDMMEPEFSKRTKFPKFFLRPLLFMVKIMYGVDFTAVSPIDSLSQIAPRPILFIHGELDEVVPLQHAYRLHEASQNPEDQLWTVPGAYHVRSYLTQPQEYIDKITVFFDGALR